jgi:hypothetical protein
MTLPAFLLGIVLATLYGAAFHLWRGGSIGRLLFYLALSWAGFWIGQLLAGLLGWDFLSVGPLHLGMATFLSAVFLFAGYWLSLVEVQRR